MRRCILSNPLPLLFCTAPYRTQMEIQSNGNEKIEPDRLQWRPDQDTADGARIFSAV